VGQVHRLAARAAGDRVVKAPVCRDCGAPAEYERLDKPGAFMCTHGAYFARSQGFPIRRLTRADFGLPPVPRMKAVMA
jgi:hypothetical protein